MALGAHWMNNFPALPAASPPAACCGHESWKRDAQVGEGRYACMLPWPFLTHGAIYLLPSWAKKAAGKFHRKSGRREASTNTAVRPTQPPPLMLFTLPWIRCDCLP